jgi:hypothetical protein
MRWFVEISSIIKPGPSTMLCVEASQWQPALQQARALRGEDGALNNFSSIDILDDGVCAIDPAARMRYVVTRAPEDAALSNGAAVEAEADGAAGEAPRKRIPGQTVGFGSTGAVVMKNPTAGAPGAAPDEVPPKKRGAAQTMAFASSGTASVHESTSAAPGLAARSALMTLPIFDLLSKREENPSERSPLSYREFVYAVPSGTTEEDAHRLLLDRFDHVRKSLDHVRTGKLINLAVFDHRFQTRPLRRPLVTLSWKDWSNEPPTIQYPLHGTSSATQASSPGSFASASPSSGPATAPSAVTPKSNASGPSTAPEMPPAPPPAPSAPLIGASARTASPAAGKPVPSPPTSAPSTERASAPGPLTSPPPTPIVPTRPTKRLSGEDLLAALFESFNDLHFVRDSLEGAEFVLMLTLEKLPSEVGLVSFFDINKREFVIVRQMGGVHSALGERQPDRAPVAASVMNKKRAEVISDFGGIARALDDRWGIIGIEIRSLICAPVELGGRYLGLIELANPLDGGKFTEGDGNALTYIGQQFAEFLASRGVIIDQDLILQRGPTTSPNKRGR